MKFTGGDTLPSFFFKLVLYEIINMLQLSGNMFSRPFLHAKFAYKYPKIWLNYLKIIHYLSSFFQACTV